MVRLLSRDRFDSPQQVLVDALAAKLPCSADTITRMQQIIDLGMQTFNGKVAYCLHIFHPQCSTRETAQ